MLFIKHGLDDEYYGETSCLTDNTYRMERIYSRVVQVKTYRHSCTFQHTAPKYWLFLKLNKDKRIKILFFYIIIKNASKYLNLRVKIHYLCKIADIQGCMQTQQNSKVMCHCKIRFSGQIQLQIVEVAMSYTYKVKYRKRNGDIDIDYIFRGSL